MKKYTFSEQEVQILIRALGIAEAQANILKKEYLQKMVNVRFGNDNAESETKVFDKIMDEFYELALRLKKG